MVLDWYTVTINALQNLWQGFLGFVPVIIGAIIVFGIGWFISIGVGKLITEILKKVKFNQLFEKGGWKSALEKAELKVDPAGFFGAIVKWVLVIVFLLAAVDILGLDQFAAFLTKVLAYLPHVIVAALIFVVTVIIVDIVEKIIRTTVEKTKVGYGNMVSAIVKTSIWIFAILMILQELIDSALIDTLFSTLISGVVALLVIAFGIAFGLGGKEVAAGILKELREKMRP